MVGRSPTATPARLAKRISTIVASAIEFEIKDPGLDGVTIIDDQGDRATCTTRRCSTR